MVSSADSRTLERIGRSLTNLQINAALLGLHVAAKAGFDPNQPRAPAGRPDGGQWTRVGAFQPTSNGNPAETTTETADPSATAPQRTVVRDESGEQTWEAVLTTRRSDGSVAEQNVVNRDGSHIRSEFASASDEVSFDDRHTVVGADGTSLTFENAGPDQLVYDGTGELLAQASWVSRGPQTTIYRPDLLGPMTIEVPGVVLPSLMLLGLGLYNWMTSVDESDQHTVASFSAREYVRGAGEAFALDSVRRLDRDEVDDFCPRYGEVQARTDQATETVRRRGAIDLTPQAFGTAVHLDLKDQIQALRDPNFRAEVSVLKSLDETYGTKNSVRIDVFENVGDGTVCVYDIKTGRRGLGGRRSAEISGKVASSFEGVNRILVIEVRPSR